MRPANTNLLLLFLSAGLLLRRTTAHTVVDPAVKSICDVATDPNICISFSKHLVRPPHGGKVDAFTVMETQMESAKRLTEAALSVISRTVGDPAAPRALKAALSSCKYGYEDLLSNIENALEAIEARDKGRMNSEFSAIITESSCEDHFQDRPGVQSPVSGYDRVLAKVAGNCLDITQKLIH